MAGSADELELIALTPRGPLDDRPEPDPLGRAGDVDGDADGILSEEDRFPCLAPDEGHTGVPHAAEDGPDIGPDVVEVHGSGRGGVGVAPLRHRVVERGEPLQRGPVPRQGGAARPSVPAELGPRVLLGPRPRLRPPGRPDPQPGRADPVPGVAGGDDRLDDERHRRPLVEPLTRRLAGERREGLFPVGPRLRHPAEGVADGEDHRDRVLAVAAHRAAAARAPLDDVVPGVAVQRDDRLVALPTGPGDLRHDDPSPVEGRDLGDPAVTRVRRPAVEGPDVGLVLDPVVGESLQPGRGVDVPDHGQATTGDEGEVRMPSP